MPTVNAVGADILFTDFMKDWLEMTRSNIEITTYGSYSYAVNAVIVPYFEKLGIQLCNLSPKNIQDFYTYNMNVRGVTANTVIHYHANIRKALKYAVNTDLIQFNPADKIQRPKRNKYIGKFYNVEEVNELFSAVKGHKLELAIMLAAFYGLRRGEVVGLKWDAIDFLNNTITIRHTVTAGMIDGKFTTVEKSTKNKSSNRSLPLIPEFADMLQKEKQRQISNRTLCGDSYNEKYTDYICVDDIGNRISPGVITENFPRILKRNNLRKIRFHDLRHTCASLLLANGVSMKDIQEWLGHSDFGTTANTYAHLMVDSKQDSANAMRSSGISLGATA